MMKSLHSYLPPQRPVEDPKDKILNVRIPHLMIEQLKDVARSEGRTLSELHRAALERVLDESKRKVKKKHEPVQIDWLSDQRCSY